MIDALLAALLLAGALAGSPGAAVQVELSVPFAPVAVDVGGTMHLVYELQLATADADVWLRRVEVLGAPVGEHLANYEGAELARVLSGTASGGDKLRVLRNTRALIYFWIALPGRTEIPDSVSHRITLATSADTSTVSLAEGGGAPVRMRSGLRALGAPLEGGPWVAVYDPELERGHRRVLFHNDAGAGHIPARFAIDWMRIDQQGRPARDDRNIVRNHYGYGAAVLAVANARVVATRDGVAERQRLVPIAHGPALASGNYITLDLGDGRYVSYEHLMPGSVRVAEGDSVRRGQVIARVGFSGDGASPHLHMHVSDGNAPDRGEGVPWALEQFELLGGYPDLATVFAARPWLPDATGQPALRKLQLPAPNVVVRFPAAISAHLGQVAAIPNVAPLPGPAASHIDE